MDKMDRMDKNGMDAGQVVRQIDQKNQQARLQIRVQFHPSKQQPYKFSAFSVLSVDKKWAAAFSRSGTSKESGTSNLP
jgi:hypothetical protein